MSQLKKILFLLLCTNIIVATPTEETKNVVHRKLTTSRKVCYYTLATAGSLCLALDTGKQAVSYLPAGTPMLTKAGVFIPTALFFLVAGYCSFYESNILGFKRLSQKTN